MRTQPTISDAILTVMNEKKVPLTINEVLDEIISNNLYEFHTESPLSVVRNQIRRSCRDLDFLTSRKTKKFGMTNDGKYYPLKGSSSKTSKTKTDSKGSKIEKPSIPSTFVKIKQLHAQHRGLLKQRILEELKKISPQAFEIYSKRLLEVYGFKEMNVTSVGRDGGIDGYGKLKIGLAFMNVAFQCKRWTKTNVGRPEIDKFRGAIQGSFEQGIFITTANFSKGAQNVSFKSGAVPIVLIDGPGLVELMIEKCFGIEQEMLPLYTYALDLIIS